MVNVNASAKSPLASKTIWGGIAAIAGALAPTLLPLIGVPVDQVPQLIAAAITVIGGIVAIVGRFTATRPIG